MFAHQFFPHIRKPKQGLKGKGSESRLKSNGTLNRDLSLKPVMADLLKQQWKQYTPEERSFCLLIERQLVEFIRDERFASFGF